MEYRKFNLLIKSDTVKKIEQIVNQKNVRNELFDISDNYYTVEDFIVGCTYYFIKQIEEKNISAGYDDLGKPFRLKNKFKDITKSKGMSQERLADLTGIAPSNISVIFRNKSQPSLDYFLRIWIALDCPPLDKCLYRERG